MMMLEYSKKAHLQVFCLQDQQLTAPREAWHGYYSTFTQVSTFTTSIKLLFARPLCFLPCSLNISILLLYILIYYTLPDKSKPSQPGPSSCISRTARLPHSANRGL